MQRERYVKEKRENAMFKEMLQTVSKKIVKEILIKYYLFLEKQ